MKEKSTSRGLGMTRMTLFLHMRALKSTKGSFHLKKTTKHMEFSICWLIQQSPHQMSQGHFEEFHTSLAPGANDEYNICLKLVVLVSNTRLLAA